MESGCITLIGATTRNPSFSLIEPLLSRCSVIHLQKLNTGDLVTILTKACEKMNLFVNKALSDSNNQQTTNSLPQM